MHITVIFANRYETNVRDWEEFGAEKEDLKNHANDTDQNENTKKWTVTQKEFDAKKNFLHFKKKTENKELEIKQRLNTKKKAFFR